MVSVTAMKAQNHEASCRVKGLFILYFHIAIHHWRKSGQKLKQGRILEAGADAEAMEGAAYWLVPLAAQPAFL